MGKTIEIEPVKMAPMTQETVIKSMAGRLTNQYKRAESANAAFVREAVGFGAMLMRVERDLAEKECFQCENVANSNVANGQLAGKNGAGEVAEGTVLPRQNGGQLRDKRGQFKGGLGDFLAANCPEINYKTALGYKGMAIKFAILMAGMPEKVDDEIIAALAAPHERNISYGAEAQPVRESTIERREAFFQDATSRRMLEKLYLALLDKLDHGELTDETKAIGEAKPDEAAAAVWARVMGVIDKTCVLDATAFLPRKAAEVCLARCNELAKALKARLAAKD